jgi:hypothetical protein
MKSIKEIREKIEHIHEKETVAHGACGTRCASTSGILCKILCMQKDPGRLQTHA